MPADVDLASDTALATRERLITRHGSMVEAWWDRLPETLAGLASAWDISFDELVGKGNTSLVLAGRRTDGRPVVIKVYPETRLAQAEVTALRSWYSSGRVPSVWGFEADLGALAMEGFLGARTVAERGVPVPLSEIADLIRALHTSGDPVVGNGIDRLSDRVDWMFVRWDRTQRDDPSVTSREQVQRGYDLGRALAADSIEPVLLHGDLHAANVLYGGEERGLVAIDPRACVGDPAFDAVDWVIWPKDSPSNWEPRSRELAAALGVDHERIWGWCRMFAAMLAERTAARGGPAERVDAFLSIAP